ncbi:MAG: PTS sugar transporter subunit IIA [Longicatena sp.]
MRIYQILVDLMEANEYLNLTYFMKKYEVSRRTIQNDLSYLIQMSSKKGYQIHMTRGSGYLLEVIDVALLEAFKATLVGNQGVDIKDRAQSILAYLALQNDYIAMDSIAEQFDMSKTTIKNNMEDVEELAKIYGLKLERRSHYGIKLHKNDKGCKQFLVDLYVSQNVLLIQVMKEQIASFEKVKEFLLKQFEIHQLNINYHELNNVIVWLEITVYYAMVKKEVHENISKNGNSIINTLVEMIESTYDVQINETSKEIMEEVLQANVRKKIPSISFSDQLEEDITMFLLEIDELYDTSFTQDNEFKVSLITHVSLLIDRLHQKISYKNTLIDELSIRYPMIFNIAIRFGDMLKDKYGVVVTRDETGFVATHFAVHMEKERKLKAPQFHNIAVICSSGGGSAYLIKLQMESLFPSSKVETFSMLQMDDVKNFAPDLIFTIMPLSQEFKVPVILIKELLDDDDLKRIRQVLQYDHYDSLTIDNSNPYLYAIFHRDFFEVKKADDCTSLITKMAEKLEQAGIGGEHFCEYVLERESYMETIYLNGVAIPHPMQMSGVRNMISVCILDKPIYYHKKDVKIVFLISLTKEDYEVHKDITKILYMLMKDEKRLSRILTTRTFEELMIVIKELDGGLR